MPNDSTRLDVAVFIDFENVYVSVRDKLDANPNFESIMDRCEDFGRVVIARAYADWYRYPRVTSALYANGIEPMYVPTYYYDREMGRTGRAIKNSVDMNLCVDAMKTLFTNPNIAKFVLATGDRDFIPLVNTIRQQGKEVIVIGIGGAASAHLAQSADEFIFYESLLGKVPAAELLPDQPRARMPEKGREQEPAAEPAPIVAPTSAAAPPREPEPAPELDVYDVLVKAIHLARERGYVCSFGSLKLLMKELMGGDFKEGRYKDGNGKPLAKFKDFVMEAERRGKVQVFTNGTVNEVFLPGEDPYKLSQFAQDLKEDGAVAEAAQPEPRLEARPTPSNRRRRRRPRGQRTGQPELADNSPLGEEDLLELVGADALGLDQSESSLDVLESYVEPDGLPELNGETRADLVFEGLLERIEQEQADRAALEALDPLAAPEVPLMPPLSFEEPATEPVAELVTEPAAELEPATAESSQQPLLSDRPFTDEEREVLREVVSRYERPVSFVQIHDALREARNRVGATLNRTNEELRTLIKQAINSSVLVRIGKGSRIAYQLNPDLREASEPTDALAPAAEADQLTQVAQAEDAEPTDVLAPANEAEASEPTDALAPADEADQLAQVVQAEVEQPVDAPAAAEVTPLEAEPAKPARRRRRKPADEAPPAEAVAPPPPAAQQPEPAEPAKPARRRRKAAPPADASANGTSHPAAEAEPAAPASPPRRRSRRKAADPVPDGQDEG